jgi:hypothetical protein
MDPVAVDDGPERAGADCGRPARLREKINVFRQLPFAKREMQGRSAVPLAFEPGYETHR